MKTIKYIAFFLSLVWAFESLTLFVHTNNCCYSIEIEWGDEEKSDTTEDDEREKYVHHQDVFIASSNEKISREANAHFYQSPGLALPDIPPEVSI